MKKYAKDLLVGDSLIIDGIDLVILDIDFFDDFVDVIVEAGPFGKDEFLFCRSTRVDVLS